MLIGWTMLLPDVHRFSAPLSLIPVARQNAEGIRSDRCTNEMVDK